ncbi:MAG TPA: hypothetical protein VMN79_02390 [Casimicrobiaceae bacterium]|nr:hypothetical protein [Casimicrobiaceae bacterium]
MNFMAYGGYSFSYPQVLLGTKPPKLPVVYAIQVVNLAWKPLPYEPIYFGENDDLESEGLAFHRAFERWRAHETVRDGGLLYVSYLWLPRGDERESIVRELIATYRPPCNFASSVTTQRSFDKSPSFA